MIVLLSIAVAAEDADRDWEARVSGDLKTFFTATLPYDHVLMPPDPTGQGIFDARLKLDAGFGEAFTLEAHQTMTALTASSVATGTSTGVGLQAPEAIRLSWTAFDEDLTLRGRIDRLSLRWTTDGFDLTVGRQPITFGHASVFTPLDLVNPFTPAVIDQEYKPGVDAVRADLYAGVASQLTLAAAYAGSWDPDGLVLAAYGQSTVRVTDVGLFVGAIRGDAVFGTSVVTSIGAVGVTSDVTLTLPAQEDVDPFVRGTLGAFFRPTTTTTVTLEAYVQTLGATKPDEMLAITADPRFQRGELWLMGVVYGAAAVSQEITPTLLVNVALIANPLDPSGFLAPSVSWSVDENVDVAIGGFVGVGARPDDIALTDLLGPNGPLPPGELTYLNSEFGTYPGVVFTQARIYF